MLSGVVNWQCLILWSEDGFIPSGGWGIIKCITFSKVHVKKSLVHHGKPVSNVSSASSFSELWVPCIHVYRYAFQYWPYVDIPDCGSLAKRSGVRSYEAITDLMVTKKTANSWNTANRTTDKEKYLKGFLSSSAVCLWLWYISSNDITKPRAPLGTRRSNIETGPITHHNKLRLDH